MTSYLLRILGLFLFYMVLHPSLRVSSFARRMDTGRAVSLPREEAGVLLPSHACLLWSLLGG
jgi:hypothetical protein